jgi:hypothetical protein
MSDERMGLYVVVIVLIVSVVLAFAKYSFQVDRCETLTIECDAGKESACMKSIKACDVLTDSW